MAIENEQAGPGEPELRCFLALSRSSEFRPVIEAVENGAHRAGFRTIRVDEFAPNPATLFDEVAAKLADADCLIADVSQVGSDVMFQIGVARGLGKAVFLLVDRQFQAASFFHLPKDLAWIVSLVYETSPSGLIELPERVSHALEAFRRSPTSFLPPPKRGVTPLIDWDRLDATDAENLCLELLSQMGFVKVEWAKEVPDFDLIAELPKKDPDGYEYPELWFVSLGRGMQHEVRFDRSAGGLEHYLFQVMRRLAMGEASPEKKYPLPITVLFILLGGALTPGETQFYAQRLIRYAQGGPEASPYLRVRIWDRGYLASVIQRFPQLAYKYFSDEGRSRARFRKTPEELYRENVALTERLVRVNAELEEEKNRRIRAERDAVWKDISFSAAHKIGNPIFAIETNLDPLSKRVRENRPHEAMEVIEGIRASVEKAKAFVEQFKSLARAQEINLRETILLPLLEDACEPARNRGVECPVDCLADLTVTADPERLAECFDELVNNALHWLDKPEPKIAVQVAEAQPPLPGSLDSSRRYVLIHFRDNGPGIPDANKERIFDAFFTTHEHGTGLGLALVRRIVEGHGGVILESGVPGKGADFEIYLPLSGEGAADTPKDRAARRRRRKV